MSEWNDAQLDALIAGHLSAELDGQPGRAEAAFLRHLVNPQPKADFAAPDVHRGLALADDAQADDFPRRPAHVNRFRGWAFTFAGAALAASIVALAAAPSLLQNSATPGRSAPGRPTDSGTIAQRPDDHRGFYRTEEQPLLRLVHSRTWDEGTVVLEGSVPARRVRHQWLEQTEWFDPEAGVRKQVTVPREDIRYVEMDTY